MKHLKTILTLIVVLSSALVCLTSCKEPVEEVHVHEYGEWIELSPATCAAEGVKNRDCKTCPAFEREKTAKLEHEYVADKTIIEATCDKAGAKLFACKHCKDIKTESLTALGHDFDGGICTRCKKLENEVATFTIKYELNEGQMYTTSATYKEGTTVTLPNPTKENYIFEGWYTTANFKEDSKITKDLTVEKNITLYAKWDIVGYIVTLNPNGGYVEESTLVLKENEQFTLEVPTIDQYVFFVGWYAGEEKITDDTGKGLKTWSITEDVTLTAKYESSKVVDVVKFTYEGEYPQSVVTNKDTIAALSKITETNKRGYLEYNNRQYASYTYTERSGIAKFNDGSYLENNKTYYFLVEPILWRILDEVKGVAIAEEILDTMHFYENIEEHLDEKDANPNNYEFSDISSWLNSDIKHSKDSFIFDAFAKPNETLELRKDIDNSAETTTDPSNPNACVTTTAYLYLLSYVEFMETYNLRLNKVSKVTDYAIARGVNIDNYSMTGEWWLRTPSAKEVNKALAISTIGIVFETKVNNVNIGVRPVGTFKKIVK